MLDRLCKEPQGCFSALPVDRFCSILCWASATDFLWQREAPPSHSVIDLELSEEQECLVCKEVWLASKNTPYANKDGLGPWRWEVNPDWWIA